MKKIFKGLLVSLVAVIALSSNPAANSAAITNVAENSNITLNGTFFTNGWGGGKIVDPKTIVDNIFLPDSTQWDQGAVWWDSHPLPPQNIELNLNGIFEINSFTIQADNNDMYNLYYKNLADNSWKLAWTVPNVVGWGLKTRSTTLTDSIITNSLKFEGVQHRSDKNLSVSEIQAFGTPAPEPSSMIFLGLLGVAGALRNRKK